MVLEFLDLFKEQFNKNAAMFKKNLIRLEADYGNEWSKEFNEHLGKLFYKDETAYSDATKGYTRFSIDAMRLQSLFNKKLKYEDVSYEEACEKVYQNEDYMMKLYLPGIFVSHFLWKHHYNQFVYYKEKFLPLLDKSDDKRFYDVGTGTGFYTIQILRYNREFKGFGIDTSPHSRKFTKKQVQAWGFEDSFSSIDVNIIGAELEPLPFIQSIEVLEHLDNPQLFLNNLRKLLKPGGYGFITAALTAPNADHIYLYWTPEEVIEQLNEAEFKVEDYIEDVAYEPTKEGENVPKLAAFIVS